MRLLAFLRSHAGEAHSVKGLKRLVEAKKCQINGRTETFSTHPLMRNDLVTLNCTELPSRQALAILFEDTDLIIYNKPPGIVCDEKNFQPNFLVHRIDKETSGLLIVAKSEWVRDAMIAQFEEKRVKKGYLALVDGNVARREGKIVSHLVKKSEYQGQTIWGSDKYDHGKEAITNWKLVKQERGLSLLHCQPLTGRTHQIRVHMSEMGFPILGDYQYAKSFSVQSVPRQMLHAAELEFIHPVSCVKIVMTAPIPADFRALFNC